MRRCVLIRAIAFVVCVSSASGGTTGQNAIPTPRHATASRTPTKTWPPPRTPWGDPDLQGVFTNQDELNVPLERPDRFAGRTLGSVTADELATFTRESNEARRRLAEQNNGFLGLSPVRFDLKPSRLWLVVDPPDGKIPPLTALGQPRPLTPSTTSIN